MNAGFQFFYTKFRSSESDCFVSRIIILQTDKYYMLFTWILSDVINLYEL